MDGRSIIYLILGVCFSCILLALLLSTCIGRMLLQMLLLPFIVIGRTLTGKKPCPKRKVGPPCWGTTQVSESEQGESEAADEGGAPSPKEEEGVKEKQPELP